ncbi:orotidine-5'-phosphate decarboxylase [Polynucleobacter meluiroseus]|uniref:Orotidine 5'-phosphate decarboxylase n=1 Tax=Polynucleobacter meluiroseus TaxID=1938814 RepID=A0A240E250_9BURK|nr:orotidine-5'-phosphate decarboxylase [Polynucleobacter meluiroseus]SNX29014.1 orotidine-5'-phosphate decarboxylase [Polynucleobacter meluiroseus]
MNTKTNGFNQQIQLAWTSQDSLLCVGFDPDSKRLPQALQGKPDGIFEFCREIADATADLVCCFKPQFAYFAAQRAEAQLEKLIGYLKSTYPHLPVILDSKRGDIGSTAEQYAAEAFERYGADAVTVNPYMGFDSIEPYLKHQGKGVIILCRTSNPGGSDLQSLNVSHSGEPLYLHLARMAAQQWNATGQISLVVGATFPEEIAQVRAIVGEMPLLIPGIGAQGGDIEATVQAGSIPGKQGSGMMINSSRAILYASSGSDFAQAARKVAQVTRDQLRAAAFK